MLASSRWSGITTSLDDGQVRRLAISLDSNVLSYRAVCDLWQHDKDFSTFFSATLAAMPFDAFFWEVRPMTMTSIDAPFECVVVDSPMLAGVTADSGPFQSQLDVVASHDGIATFENLGGDALLVAPCAGPGKLRYAHFAEFLRHAPETKQQTFWACIGSALESRLSHEPVWLSTSGLGVYWLHVRLDRQPKYYTYAPYRKTEVKQW